MKISGKRIICFFLFFFSIAVPFKAVEAEEDRPELVYFFENYCDVCHPEKEFAETFYALTGHHIEEYSYSYYDMRYEKNRTFFEETAEEYGIVPAERLLPMVIVDGKVYSGDLRVESMMPLNFLENTSTDSVIYYLYSPVCESCVEAEKEIDKLPETVQVKRGLAEFDSELVVYRIDIYEDPSVARSLFQRYSVPEQQQTTPIVFLREDYINGADGIKYKLPYMLKMGLAVGTSLIAPTDSSEIPALSAAGTALAGLIAGFNPCALSMLLLFLSVLLSSDKGMLCMAFLYLAAKLFTYVVIGTGLLSVFIAWDPAWLPFTAKILLTCVGCMLIVLNIMDALAACRGNYGNIKNQLPHHLRRFLNERIRRSIRGKGAALCISVLLLGVIVAAGEFLCSGQLYLASLTAGFAAGFGYIRQLMLLMIFCLSFLLPSVLITLIIMKSRDMFAASNAILRRMPLIKLVSAIMMLVIILSSWFLL